MQDRQAVPGGGQARQGKLALDELHLEDLVLRQQGGQARLAAADRRGAELLGNVNDARPHAPYHRRLAAPPAADRNPGQQREPDEPAQAEIRGDHMVPGRAMAERREDIETERRPKKDRCGDDQQAVREMNHLPRVPRQR